jgi:hypothetical protein
VEAGLSVDTETWDVALTRRIVRHGSDSDVVVSRGRAIGVAAGARPADLVGWSELGAVVERLVASLPAVRTAWEGHPRSESIRPGEPRHGLAWLARTTAERMARSETAGFDYLFSTVEEILARASEQVRDLVVLGLLKRLQGQSLHSSIPLHTWEPWLGPMTTASWRVLTGLQERHARAVDLDSLNRGVDLGKPVPESVDAES